MTDHKYPNEVASCHSMLKKRDAIIADLNQQLPKISQPFVPSDELIKVKEELLQCQGARDHWEIIATKAGDNAIELARRLEECERGANLTYENRIEELEQQLEQFKKEVDEPSPGVLLWQEKCARKNEEIVLLEAKLALCDKLYNGLKQALKELLENDNNK